MRITKRELKKIINEELEATIQERDGDKMAQAEELAQALSQSPAIMAAVEKAAQDPKVQAAAEKALAQARNMQEQENPMADAYRKKASIAAFGSAVGGAVSLAGVASMFSPTVLAAIGASANTVQSMAAFGFTGGVAAMTLGMIVMQHLMMKSDDAEQKASGRYRMDPSDFSRKELDKMYNRG